MGFSGKVARSLLPVLATVCVWSTGTGADQGHEHKQDHGEKMPRQHQEHMTGEGHGQMHGQSEGHEHHRHDSWEEPPAEYAAKNNHGWADVDSIARGKEIYKAQCASCHGADGRGTGPAASALVHTPADLTWHFHMGPGKGDAYLFWRVSEGGLVEPFKSQDSAMPAFKETLTEEQRWDVLSYVHAFFHLGLEKWKAAGHQ